RTAFSFSDWLGERMALTCTARKATGNETRIELKKTACSNTKKTRVPACDKSPVKRHYSELLFAALALIPVALLAQNPAPTPRYSDETELSKVEEWVLSQGTGDSIAPELAAIFGLGSDRLPVRLKSFRTTGDISYTFAVSTNPRQKGIVLSALKTIADKMKIYSVGTAWLTDGSGTLRRTIAVDASGARVLQDRSRAAEFKNMKDFFVKKIQATSPSTA